MYIILQTGRYRTGRPKTGRYIRFSDVTSGLEPVWNRFGTGFGRFGRLEPVSALERLKTGRYIRFSDVIYIYNV